MAKTSRHEDGEVQAVIKAGTLSVKWVQQEFSDADLGDKRLNRRLIRTAQQLASSPASPINEACGDWASTQASYRLFDNEKATPQAILAPHIAETLKRMAAQSEPVLVMQDTVYFCYGQHPKTRGLGPIGSSNCIAERGLIMHNALAFSVAGVPLGLLSQTIWARGQVPDEGGQDKIARLQCTPIEEKESSKWLVALNETVQCTAPGSKVITVADRESDFFEFLMQAQEQRASFLIRARTDRKLLAEDSEGYESMVEALADAAVLGTLEVAVPGNGKRPARTAQVQVSMAQVTIQVPRRRKQAQSLASLEPVSVKVIAATETCPPEGVEPISWVLLTNLPVPDFDSAAEKIGWYAQRFSIETWHKVLKSGCKVEDCLLATAERLMRYLTLFSIIGVRLMHVAYLARAQPNLPATAILSAEEIEALHVRLYKKRPPPKPPSVREAVRMIGRIGGHLGRKCDKEPGMTVIWRGWMRLYEDVLMLRACKQSLGRLDPG